ncbi:MAG: hypothetical protein JNN08_13060 [Bryobacterales bacterium]|nr:hypothetical protein [Bryobacterales bacterium]
MSNPNQLYRTPPKPGFVGGYNFSALMFGIGLLFGTNFGATQYVGNKFDCQAALGRPLIIVGGTCIYPPLHWAKWLLEHGQNTNPDVRLHVLSGALIVVVGASVTVGVVYALNLNRARRLSANTEDLHGSARWANRSDIEETGMLGAPQGVLCRRMV